ncbi:DNA-3-methyladenine glycosylase 2 family protein [Solimicrobium silvestre]|uniref:DNA-3-methyladenine glycosylase II n=1 Tax=Solimicrobium silvestre TaxID=2099400 RepID=A0A2S9GTS5_9BURK|nr:DNA-3-methyladenine glycosylase 2 [Solimicrobium silvestre]PRC91115.1 AlkA N-terminal domain [Solimicrobium silvestre]
MKNLFTPSTPITASSLDHANCYRALCAKDSRFDGEFFVGVSTTGIYCRPVCRVKTPRPSSCTFYQNASSAEAAGFRPCLRCRPELAPYALQQNLAYAIWQRISAGALNNRGDGGNMQELAQQVGLSARQLQRLMQNHFGVSPIELAQTARLLFAKKLLQETSLAMTELAYAAGFGSVRRFNALFLNRYGMAPSAIRRSATSKASTDHITLRLAYRAPFAWDTMLDYLAGRIISGVEAIEEDVGVNKQQRYYVRSVNFWHGKEQLQGWLKVSNLSKEQQLEVQLSSNFSPVLMPLLAKVRQQFDLDANPTIVEAHLSSDPLLAAQIKRTPGLRVPGAFNRFELAIRAVLGQQISVAGATTLAARLIQQFGTPSTTPFSSITHHFPEPAALAALSQEQIAQLGMPKSRAATILAVAQFAADGGLELPLGSSLDKAVAHLKTVRGIGEWTAQYIALRVLRYPDAFPAGDLGLQKAAAVDTENSAGKISEAQLLNRAQSWTPWRGYAALLLWQSLSN